MYCLDFPCTSFRIVQRSSLHPKSDVRIPVLTGQLWCFQLHMAMELFRRVRVASLFRNCNNIIQQFNVTYISSECIDCYTHRRCYINLPLQNCGSSEFGHKIQVHAIRHTTDSIESSINRMRSDKLQIAVPFLREQHSVIENVRQVLDF